MHHGFSEETQFHHKVTRQKYISCEQRREKEKNDETIIDFSIVSLWNGLSNDANAINEVK